MAEDFSFITDDDRNSAAYTACVAGMTIVGIAGGAFLSSGTAGAAAPLLVVGGAAGGLAVGKALCPLVTKPFAEKIKAKIGMTEAEFGSLMNEISAQVPGKTRSEVRSIAAMVVNDLQAGRYS